MSTAPAQERVVQGDSGPPPGPARPDAVEVEQDHRGAAAAAPRGRRAPRPKPAPADTEAAPATVTAADASEAEEMLAGVAAAQGGGPRVHVVGRGRRAGQPPTPRWMVAGKMRRGRLK